MNPEAIFKEARAAAITAVETGGPEGAMSGFAWVTIHPARGIFVNWLKKNGHGKNGWSGGWMIWNPGEYGGQCIDLKYAGAWSFAKVLEKYGIWAEAGSRFD